MNDGREARNIREAVDAMAQAQPETAFLISPETGNSVPFQKLKQQSVLLSCMLRQAGLEKGDKVAFLMDNGLLTAQLFLGTMYGGYVAVPLNVRAGAAQLSYMLDHCDAKVIFVEDQYTGLLRETLGSVRRDIRVVAADVDGPLPAFESAIDSQMPLSPAADDVALLMYSSGSTGKPKAAIHTHISVLAHGHNSIQAHQLSSTDRSLLVLPLYHINAECVTLIPTLLSGGSVVVAHRFLVSKFWDWIDDLHVTWSAVVPTIISELVDWNDPGKDRRQSAFQRIRFLRSSSAPLSPSLHQQFLDRFKLPLLQAMGSTEGGNVFSNPLPPRKNKIGSPGLPWGFETRIVDRADRDVPQGEAGEVLLRGAGLMTGYYKDPEGTAAVMDSDGWLHTGDLARQDEDGYFFVVGRSKELIIKGGVNIAPRQIDEVLESHPAVFEAAAVGVPDRYFGEDAVAFVVLRSETTADERELLAFCETRLGHFKSPSRIHFLKELPKGPSGKVQRLRLLDPAVLSAVAATAQPESNNVTINGSSDGSDKNPPAAELTIEQIIATAWAEVLAVPAVELKTNFFALGGHSLLAIQCLSKLRDKLPIVLSLSDFFEFSTVAEQAELVRQRLRPASRTGGQELTDESTNWEQLLLQQRMPSADEEEFPRADPSIPHPLSPAQQRLWFLERLNPSVPVYNEAEAVRLTGPLNVDALERAMNVIVDRREVMRSTIKIIDEVPHAVIHESWPLRFKRIDISALPAAERQAEIERLLIDEPRAQYHLETEPGVRVALIRLGPREHVFILMMHHIICDWASEGIIWRELSAVYRSFLSGEPVVLPTLPIKHGDYALWQHERLAAKGFTEDLAFWEETLRGAPELLELPSDRPRPPMMSYKGDRIRWKLNNALTEGLRATSQKENSSLFTIFSAALDTLLFRYTGSDDILLGIPLADRDLPELQEVVGFMLHTHVLRTRLSGDMTFRDLLSRVQKGVLELYAHRSAPFDQVVQRLQPVRNLSYTPMFQVMLNWRDRDQMLPFIGLEGLAIDSLMATAATSKFDMLLVATDIGDEIWLELEFNTDLFDRDRMARMLGHYQTLLENIAAGTSASLAEIPLLTDSESQQVLYGWNATAAEFAKDKCVHQLFEDQAEKTPDAVAVVFEGASTSYAKLNRDANQLAHYLRKIGVKPDARVAVCVERSFEMVVALMAVLKAGGAYVPLDPSYPMERLRFMIEDSEPVAVLTQSHLAGLFLGIGENVPVLDLTVATAAGNDQPVSNPDLQAMGLNPSHLAYVIYTSGSTGNPKGVLVHHRGVVNRLLWMQNAYGLTSGEAVLQKTPFSFDVSVWEFFWTLLVGARLVMARPESHKDPDYLVETVRRNQITTMHFVPSMLQAFLEHQDLSELPSLVRVVCSGEALSASLLQRFQERLPYATLHNLYGPTEAAVDVTAWTAPANFHGCVVPIGKPVWNTQMYILDGQLEPVPIGVSGELYIGGVQVARGYLNRAELTAERFVADPFSSEPGARMYRTGDLARWLADGNIEYLGRNDFQVKIHGFRIELGEIEAALEQHEGISQCVVAVQWDDLADKRLVAYIVPTDPRAVPTVEDLRDSLKQRLPNYMIPPVFSVIEKIPLTHNGKIDRKALSSVKVTAIASEVPVEAPRDSFEARLVQIWEQLLEAHPIGIRANFFDLGGHSLMAVKMFAQIKKEFQRSLPLASIIGSPTIEQLATLIRGRDLDMGPVAAQPSGSSANANSSVVPIQPNGAGAPLFIIHGRLGNVLRFYDLAMLIGTDHPIYGVQAQSLLEGQPALLRLEDQAAYYVAEIRKVWPNGPYCLLGYSFGGTVAFEMTQQLLAMGERVQLLGMLDAPQRDCTMQMLRDDSMHRLDRRIARHLVGLGRLGLREKVVYIRERLDFRIRTRVYLAAAALGFRSVPSFMKNAFHISRAAAINYQARPWPGPVTVFRASVHWDPRLPRDLGWKAFAKGGVEVCEVLGDHDRIFEKPNIENLADQLRAWLQQSEAATPQSHEPAYSAR